MSRRFLVPPRWRRRLVVAGVLPALAALAFTAKVITMMQADQDGLAQFDQQRYPQAREAFDRNLSTNLLEGWVAPYDEGTTRYRLGDYTGAERSLRESLAAAPADQACRVRINLALSLEGQGDQAQAEGQQVTARVAWQAGLDVVDRCLKAPPATHEQAGDARSIDARLREKLLVPPTDQPTQPPASESAAQLLADLNARGEQIRRRNEQQHQDEEDQQSVPPSGGGPSYHW